MANLEQAPSRIMPNLLHVLPAFADKAESIGGHGWLRILEEGESIQELHEELEDWWKILQVSNKYCK